MPARFVSSELLSEALGTLKSWYSSVTVQGSRHVWSVLPLKARGAMPDVPLTYAEHDDLEFMKRYLQVRPDSHAQPFFDPFSRHFLPAGYFHSNMATMRKNRFVRAWGACDWNDDVIKLHGDYGDVVVSKVLTKGGNVVRIPAIACAIWFFKRPHGEWPGDATFADGVPGTAAEAVALFRTHFNYNQDDAWHKIFDDSPDYIPNYAELLSVSS